MHVIRGGPAGGGYSTAEDLVAVRGGAQVGEAGVARDVRAPDDAQARRQLAEYGYGFGVDPQTGIVGHSGGFPGISSNLDIFKGTGYVAVVMSNYGGASQPVVEKIRALVRGRVSRGSEPLK